MNSARYHGTDYDEQRDRPRLDTAQRRVEYAATRWDRNGGWFTHDALATFLRLREGTVERLVRYLRDPQHGGYTVEKRHVSGGLHEYRVRKPDPSGQGSFGW